MIQPQRSPSDSRIRPSNAVKRGGIARDALREWRNGDGLPSNGEVLKADALFVMPRGTFNLATELGLVADKSELMRRELVARGSSVLTIVHPYRLPRTPSYAYPVFGINQLLLRSSLARCQGVDADERQRRLWTYVLDRVRPKAVFGILLPPQLCVVARDRGIACVELMHGLIGWWFAARQELHAPESRPTHMLTWDACYNPIVESAGIRGISVGYPQLAVPLPQSNAGARTVLVALAYNIGDSADPFGLIERDLHQAMEAVRDASHEVGFRFRLHPTYAQNRPIDDAVAWLRQQFPHCSVSIPSQTYVIKDILQCAATLIYPSSLALEASLVGTPSIIVSRRTSNTSATRHKKNPLANNGTDMTLPSAMSDAGLVQFSTPEDAGRVFLGVADQRFQPFLPALDCSLRAAFDELLDPVR